MRSDETSPRRDFNPLESGRNQPQGSTYPPITQFRTQQQPLEPYYNHTINAQSPFDPRLSRISQPPTPSFPPSSIVLPGQPNGPPAGPILGQASSITESPAPLTPGTGPTQAPDNRKDSMATQMQKTQLNSRRSTIQSPQPFGGMAPPLKSPGHHPTLPSIHSLPPPSHTLPSQQGPPTGLPNFGAPLPPGQQSSGSSQYQPHSLPNPGVPSGSGSMSSQSQGSRQNTEPGSGAGYIGIDVPSLIKLVKDLEVEVGDLRRRVISLESQLTVANGGGGGGSGKGPAMAGQL